MEYVSGTLTASGTFSAASTSTDIVAAPGAGKAIEVLAYNLSASGVAGVSQIAGLPEHDLAVAGNASLSAPGNLGLILLAENTAITITKPLLMTVKWMVWYRIVSTP